MRTSKKLLLLALIISILSAAESLKAQQPIRIAMIIAPANFYDKEYIEPKSIFDHNNAEVITASTTKVLAKGRNGLKVQPDAVISDLKADDFDAIVIIGGKGVIKHLWGNKQLEDLVKDANDQNKVVAAICLAPAILARTGILKGKNATCYPDSKVIEELKKTGAIYIDNNVVTAGNIITGNGPDSAKDFGLKVWEITARISK